jgi:hypothetical protein
MREHQKQEVQELGAVKQPIPEWVFLLSALLPFITVAIFITVTVFMVVIYGLKFDSLTMQNWAYATVTGVCMVFFLLDMIRVTVITIVELRKYEIRKRSRMGDFVVRKIQKADEKSQIPSLLRPKPKPKAQVTPPVPKVAPKFNSVDRPSFLPPTIVGDPNNNFDSMSGAGTPHSRYRSRTPTNRTPRSGSRTPMGGARTPMGARSRRPGAITFGQSNPHQDFNQTGSSKGMQTMRGMSSTAPGMPAPPPAPPPPGVAPPGGGAQRANMRAKR